MIFGILLDVALLATGVFALARGGRPEKIGALVNVSATIASSALRLLGYASWRAGSPTVLIDVAVAAIFFWLACRTSRFWPIWSFGFVLALVAVDLVKLALPAVSLFAFASGQVAYVYLALITLALGTFRASRSPLDPGHGFRSYADNPSR